MSRTTSDRLAVKTLDQRFRHELETGFEIPPRVAQGILEAAKAVFNLDAVTGEPPDRLRPGQIRQVIAAAGAPHGCPLQELEMVEVVWTVDAGAEDGAVYEAHGTQALRRIRILRLVDEALDQGGEPTQEDLAKALGVTARTIPLRHRGVAGRGLSGGDPWEVAGRRPGPNAQSAHRGIVPEAPYLH